MKRGRGFCLQGLPGSRDYHFPLPSAPGVLWTRILFSSRETGQTGCVPSVQGGWDREPYPGGWEGSPGWRGRNGVTDFRA